MNKSRQNLAIAVIALFALSIILALSIAMIGKSKQQELEYQERINGLNSLIGKKLILDKDTLTIIDYSIIFDNVTLSNGTKVDLLYTTRPGKLIN